MNQLTQLKQIKTVKLDELQPWKLNPRFIKSERFEELKRRIQEHGFNDVLKVAADGKTVIGGNMRLRALKELGTQEVQILLTGAGTPQEMLAIALDDNEEFGQYDREMLVELAYTLEIPELELNSYLVHLEPPVSIGSIISEDTTEEADEDDTSGLEGGGRCLKCPRHCLSAREAPSDVR